MRLSQINIYPIKSCGGISLGAAKITPTGLEHDRRWMLVDESNVFITQRAHPEMSQIEVRLTGSSLKVSHRKMDLQVLHIPFDPVSNERLEVKCWENHISARTVSAEADAWFSQALGLKCRLVNFDEQSRRQVRPKYAPGGTQTGFPDGFPFLILGESALSHLNSLLEQPIGMDRFRPNFVFQGGRPFAEDNWKQFQIGEASFERVKPCARCAIPTIDQQTAKKGKEPSATLATFRKVGNQVMFGQNLICHSGTEVKVGDEITF